MAQDLNGAVEITVWGQMGRAGNKTFVMKFCYYF